MCWPPTDRGITFVNDEACRLLEIGTELGGRIDEIGLTPRVLDVFTAGGLRPRAGQCGPSDRRGVGAESAARRSRTGHRVGGARPHRCRVVDPQLDAVQVMSTALRAQRHEFANRLHLLNGLLHTGHVEEASAVSRGAARLGPLGSAIPGIDSIGDTHLQAFLAAKAAAAREAGVTLKIGENTWVSGRLELPVDVTTVVGNLIDNAIDAARASENAAKAWKSSCCRRVRHCTSRLPTVATVWHPTLSRAVHRGHLD